MRVQVWDYAGDGYVHRLIQSKTDGKLVEVAPPRAGQAREDASCSRWAAARCCTHDKMAVRLHNSVAYSLSCQTLTTVVVNDVFAVRVCPFRAGTLRCSGRTELLRRSCADNITCLYCGAGPPGA